MTQLTYTPLKNDRRLILLSLALLSCSIIFWTSVFISKFLHLGLLDNAIEFADGGNPLLPALLLLIFPLLAIALNALSVVRFSISFNGEMLHLELQVYRHLIQWFFIIAGCMSVGILALYIISSKFALTPVN